MGTARRDLRISGDLVMAPRVPHGLAAAVEGLTREVIRHRPEDIYVFAAQHFEELLKLRDEYGAVTNLPGKSTNTAALREMNQALKKRNGTSRSGEKEFGKSKEHGGWSMNETAKVLERHRSIFGDKGRKLSPEEVRALGNEKENKSRSKDDFAKFAAMQKRRGSNERFVKKRTSPKDAEFAETKSKSDSTGNPKIISQIPRLTGTGSLLAKDIKSELRKNRNSSRDGRSIRERAEKKTSEKTERFEMASRNPEASKKNLIRRFSRDNSMEKFCDRDNDEDFTKQQNATDNQKHKTDANTASRSLAKIPRTLSMDRVRQFVVERFRSSESWDDLTSMNYVERVQEVIDDAAPTIRKKVKELSTRSAGRSRGYESVDESTSTSTRSDKSNQTDDIRIRSAMSVSRRSKRRSAHRRSKSKSKTSGADSLEGIETLASETEHSKELARNDVETPKLPESQSRNEEERAGHNKSANNQIADEKSSANGFSGESDVSENVDGMRKASISSSISLPAVRPLSSKNHSRSVSRSDSDNLVLPPISPEVSKSAKQREELVLPSLPFPPRTPESEESKEVHKELKTPKEEVVPLVDVELNLPDAPTEEVFNDSLNVTPEINASPRPDSLEVYGGRARNDEVEDNIAELKSKLNEMVSDGEKSTGMAERLREIEETEKSIGKILLSENCGGQTENADVASVKEKLVEIQEAEERLRDALNSDARKAVSSCLEAGEIQGDGVHTGIQGNPMEIEETAKNIKNIFSSEDQEAQNDQTDIDVKKRLMEIEEAEKTIEKILYSEAEEIQDDKSHTKTDETQINVDETDAKIAEILLSDTQDIQENQDDGNIKEKLSDIKEAVKNIDKVLPPNTPDIMKTEVELDRTEKELTEVLDTSKRLKNDSGSPREKENRDEVIIVQQNDQIEHPKTDFMDKSIAIPKTPFIPEIPSEYVSVAGETDAIGVSDEKVEVEHVATVEQNPRASFNIGIANEEREGHNELQVWEQFTSGTPDSLGNSYILTEGSPYDIPDTVTTVIIPERQLDSPSSDIPGLVLEDDFGNGSGITAPNANEDPKNISEISLRNILDNFGEIVQKEAVVRAPAADIDFIRGGLKAGNETIVTRKDLGQIREENDKEITEMNNSETPVSSDLSKTVVTPTLEDIIESEEILETQDIAVLAQNPAKIKSAVLENENHGSAVEIMKKEVQKITTNQATKTLEVREKSDEVKRGEDSEILIPEDENRESLNETAKVTSPRTATIESLQQNVTDSATTESTDEVKETTISDDGGNTAPESSVTSPSCAENIGTRNSESSNEVKETTISDQPADDVGKNLFNLIPQCHGSMPHVPELNLDSLQDITVSSFQLSDDVTAEEDSEAGQPPSVNGNSFTTEAEELNESQSQEPIHEEMIIKKQVTVKEDPCTKVSAYVTEPDAGETDSSDSKVAEVNIVAVESTLRRETAEKLHEEVTEQLYEEETEKISGEIAALSDQDVPKNKIAEELVINMSAEVPEQIGNDAIEGVKERKAETVVEKIVETIHEEVMEKLPEEVTEKIPNYPTEKLAKQVAGKVDQGVSEKISEEATEDIAKVIPGKVLEQKVEQVTKEGVEKATEKVHEEIASEISEFVIEKMTENIPTEIPENLTEEPANDPASRPISGQMDTVSLKSFKALEANVEDEFLKKPIAENLGSFDDPQSNSSERSAVPEDGGAVERMNEPLQVPGETEGTAPLKRNGGSISSKHDSLDFFTESNPSKAGVTTNELFGDENSADRMEYHIYVPDVTTSEDSTTESSTFNSAATKIQAGVRGFLTRRRLQSAQRRSSTLDSVPSIQESFATDAPHLEPIEEVGLAQAATTIQSSYRGYKARKRLRREDAVQKTTLSVENAFSGGGLQHTGEFHDCLPLLLLQHDVKNRKGAFKSSNYQPQHREDDSSDVVISRIEEQEKSNASTDESPKNRESVTDIKLSCMNSTTREKADKEKSVDENSTVALLMKNYPHAHEGLNLVVVSNNDVILQSQYLNFITSIEEVRNETDSLIGPNSSKVIESVSSPKSNVGIESLPMDDTCSDVSVGTSSIREPLAIPGTPTGIVIEELSKTDDGSMQELTSTIPTDKDVKSRTNLAEGLSEIPGDSLELPGLSLERQAENCGQMVLPNTANFQSIDNQVLHSILDDAEEPDYKNSVKDGSEIGRVEEVLHNNVISVAPDVPQDGSLGTMSFSMNVDDMLGLGAESDPPSNMKPIFEVTVTPRDLLKLKNKSHGSQANGERVESPVTMMQIVPKSVEEKSEKSEEEKGDEVKPTSEKALDEQRTKSETGNTGERELLEDGDGDCNSTKKKHEESKKTTTNVEPLTSSDENEILKSVSTAESLKSKDKGELCQGMSKTISIDNTAHDSAVTEKKSKLE